MVSFLKKHWKSLLIILLSVIVVFETIMLMLFVPVSFQPLDPLMTSVRSQAREVFSEKSVLKIVIDQQGNMSLNGMPLKNHQPETVFTAMTQLLDDQYHDVTPQLVISADAEVDYQSVVKVMDTAARIGLRDVSLETLKEE